MSFIFLPKKTTVARIGGFLESFEDATFEKTQYSLLTPLDPSQREQRRERGREDVEWWLRTYLPQYFTFPFSPSHERIFELFYVKGQLVVIVLPRDSGKGTTLFGLTLHGMTYDLLPFPTRVEHNFDIALQELQKFEDALTNNPRYLADFDLRPGSPWRASKGLLTLNNRRQLRYIGMDQVARGAVSLNFRIDPLIANDLESLTSVRSPTQTQKIFDFIAKDSAHAGASLSEGGHTYIYVGTKISKNCATQQMIDSPMAESYEFPAIVGDKARIKDLMKAISDDSGNMREFNRRIREERQHLPRAGRNPTSEDRSQYVFEHPILSQFSADLSSYWPERFEMWDIIFEAAKGTDIFMQEMMHNPGDAKFQKFYRSWFVAYDGVLPEGTYKFGLAIDTSGLPKEGTDPMAVVAGGLHLETGNFFVLEVWSDQATPEDLLNKVHEIYWRNFRSQGRDAYVFFEQLVSAGGMGTAFFRQGSENQRQKHPEKAEFWKTLDVIEVPATVNKDLRLISMRPEIEKRKIHVWFENTQQSLMVKQWCNWVPGTNPHKAVSMDYKVDAADMLTLLYQNIKKHSRPPVVLFSPPSVPKSSASSGRQSSANHKVKKRKLVSPRK